MKLRRRSVLVLPFASAISAAALEGKVHCGMGFRVGEVTATSALVWTRLTARAEPNWNGVAPDPVKSPTRVIVKNAPIPPEDYEGAFPGVPGRVRVVWSTHRDLANASVTEWSEVNADADYTHQFSLRDLRPATVYFLRVEARDPAGQTLTRSETGSFRTAAPADQWQDVTFVMTTCQMYYHRDDPRGFRIYPAMGKLNPHFYIQAGDNVYYDRDNPRATSVPLCRLHWNRMYGLPNLVEFFRHVPGYWEKDDHDTFFDDCWRTYKAPWIAPLTYEDGLNVFREQVPIGDSFYRTVRWGSGLQIWFTEGRDFRSPNTLGDGPGKSVWGREQKEWLKRTILESDAAFKILASPTAIVGPDNPGQADGHANAVFSHEGAEFRQWTKDQSLRHFYVCNGDRHWQYQSTDPDSGLREFSCGPASDAHAFSGPGMDPRYHSFYRAKGGFLSASVTRDDAGPAITFRFHDVDGNVMHEFKDRLQS